MSSRVNRIQCPREPYNWPLQPTTRLWLVAAERPIRYTAFPAAVGPMLRRATQGFLKLASRLPQGDAMRGITPPAIGILSDFRPPSMVRITSGWSRPPTSAAQPPIRYADRISKGC